MFRIHTAQIEANEFSPIDLDVDEASTLAKVYSRSTEERQAKVVVVLDELNNPVEFWYNGFLFKATD